MRGAPMIDFGDILSLVGMAGIALFAFSQSKAKPVICKIPPTPPPLPPSRTADEVREHLRAQEFAAHPVMEERTKPKWYGMKPEGPSYFRREMERAKTLRSGEQ